jgi:hypothetical protein
VRRWCMVQEWTYPINPTPANAVTAWVLVVHKATEVCKLVVRLSGLESVFSAGRFWRSAFILLRKQRLADDN